jgi:hypothetical protein
VSTATGLTTDTEMEPNEQAVSSQFSASFSSQLNGDARFVSKNVRDISSQLKVKMAQTAKSPIHSREGFAFEYLDAIDQQISLGGKYKVGVPGVNGKNSPDIQIQSRASGKVVQEQQLKLRQLVKIT